MFTYALVLAGLAQSAALMTVPVTSTLSATTTGSISVTDYQNAQYYATITLGTPAQSFRMLLDTTVADVIVPSTSCSTSCNNKARYSETKSSTFVPKKTPYTKAWNGGTITGFQSMDTMNYAGYDIPFQGFVEMTSISNTANYYSNAYDGILGLGFDQQSVNAVATPITSLVNEHLITAKVFGIKFGNSTGEIGTMTIGGYEGSVSAWLPATYKTPSQWTLSMQQLTSKGVTLGASYVHLATAAPFITGPAASVSSIATGLGAWLKSGSSTRYEVGCDLTLPDITFVLTDGAYSHSYPLRAGDYLLRQSSGNVCDLGIVAGSVGDKGDEWELGGVFWRHYDAVFDVSNRRVGLQV